MIKIYSADVTLLTDERIYSRIRSGLLKSRQNKADSYRFLWDRCRSLAVGELLRQVTLKHGIPYEDSSFIVCEDGKPDFANHPLHFSLSHSGRYALCALSDRAIGCDIEEIRQFDIASIEKFFADDEIKKISDICGEKEKTELFFRLWTLKESFVKCCGCGIYLDFSSFTLKKDNAHWAVRQSEDSFCYTFGERANDGYQFSWCVRSSNKSNYMQDIAETENAELITLSLV